MTVQLYIKLHNITIFVLHMVDLPKNSHHRFFQSLQSLPKKKNGFDHNKTSVFFFNNIALPKGTFNLKRILHYKH